MKGKKKKVGQGKDKPSRGCQDNSEETAGLSVWGRAVREKGPEKPCVLF